MQFLNRYAPQILSLTRFVAGLQLTAHGMSKLIDFPHLATPQPAPLTLVWFAGLIEITAGPLIAIGFFSRYAAFIASGLCAVAYFMVHIERDFFPNVNNGDAAILFSFIFLYIAAAGPGPWAINRK